jgi:drug/metabolite transporter (DMT)-like permease
MVNQKKAYAYGLATVFLWSTVATAFKLALRHIDTSQLLLYASLVSVLVLGLLLAVTGRFSLLFGFTRKQYLHSLLYGFLNPFVYYLMVLKAYDLLPAQEAQPINYTWAITLALLSIPLLGQKISRQDFLAAFVAYSGVLFISTHGQPWSFRFSNGPGVALALGCTVIWALYWILNRKDTRDPLAGLMLNSLFSLPFTFVFCLLFSSPIPETTDGLAAALYVGLVEMGITFVTWRMALQYSVNTSKVGNLVFLAPFLSLVFIHFFLGEEIRGSTFIGLALIITGLAIQQYRGGKKIT